MIPRHLQLPDDRSDNLGDSTPIDDTVAHVPVTTFEGFVTSGAPILGSSYSNVRGILYVPAVVHVENSSDLHSTPYIAIQYTARMRTHH